MDKIIEIKGYSLVRENFALRDIDLDIYDNECFAILGRTGSGKTMLLESIAGYYSDGSGSITISGKDVRTLPAEKRRIGFVYQDHGLFPHMTVFKNIAYGLSMRKTRKNEIRERVHDMAAAFGISNILDQYPGTLSGGEKQRTAMARALITKPDVLLLDEPFSALDPATKDSIYGQFCRIRERHRCPILFVTHDFNEAQLLADRIGIMNDGKLCGIRTPKTLFQPFEDDELNRFLRIDRAVE